MAVHSPGTVNLSLFVPISPPSANVKSLIPGLSDSRTRPRIERISLNLTVPPVVLLNPSAGPALHHERQTQRQSRSAYSGSR